MEGDVATLRWHTVWSTQAPCTYYVHSLSLQYIQSSLDPSLPSLPIPPAHTKFLAIACCWMHCCVLVSHRRRDVSRDPLHMHSLRAVQKEYGEHSLHSIYKKISQQVKQNNSEVSATLRLHSSMKYDNYVTATIHTLQLVSLFTDEGSHMYVMLPNQISDC